jgi:hypothetical protein
LASAGRIFLAGAALCAAQAGIASEKRSVTIGARVIATSQCRVDAASGARCSRSGAAPQVIAATAKRSSQAVYEGQLVMKMSAVGASLDSRGTAAPTLERVVLTIAP